MLVEKFTPKAKCPVGTTYYLKQYTTQQMRLLRSSQRLTAKKTFVKVLNFDKG